jgi:hypothetical protein
MFVENNMVGILRVSWHAVHRWKDRGQGELIDSIARAVPYGGQRNGSMLLRDGVNVFAVSSDKVVTTVLTSEMAIANMQMSLGVRMDTCSSVVIPPPQTPKTIVSTKKKNPNKIKKETSEGVFADSLFDKTDSELVEMLTTVGGMQKQAINRMLSLRANIKKQMRHAELMDLERKAVVHVVASRLNDSELKAFFQELRQTQEWFRELHSEPDLQVTN